MLEAKGKPGLVGLWCGLFGGCGCGLVRETQSKAGSPQNQGVQPYDTKVEHSRLYHFKRVFFGVKELRNFVKRTSQCWKNLGSESAFFLKAPGVASARRCKRPAFPVAILVVFWQAGSLERTNADAIPTETHQTKYTWLEHVQSTCC